MFGEEKNLKDSEIKQVSSYGPNPQNMSFTVSYTKTHKLITALYMVTDIIDKDEPIRNKLRTLGTGIISDMHLMEHGNTNQSMSLISQKITEILSFLDIAAAINIISEMNGNILRKEFSALDQSAKDSLGEKALSKQHKQVNLSEFFTEDTQKFSPLFDSPRLNPILGNERSNSKSISSIGVQKGSTLMKALSDKINTKSQNTTSHIVSHRNSEVFDVLKKQRQSSLLNIIKNITEGATIKDIKDKINTTLSKSDPLASCGDKTLQRELMSMVQSSVLYKTGEKRWSRYFVKN
jgi:hypothetical protein